jgi:hypothetical protein
MSATREAVVLPVLFLTITLLGGIRIADRVAFQPPSVFSVVLAFILLGVLVRSGTLAPAQLMSASRDPLANVTGAVVIVTTLAAAAQTFSLMTPERGLPHVAFSAFFLVLLLNTFTAAPDRVRLLRSVAVIFGSAFLLKFVVLAALADPTQGRLTRVLLILFEGITLGTVTQAPLHPAAAYLALLALVLFLSGLALLPPAGASSRALQTR